MDKSKIILIVDDDADDVEMFCDAVKEVDPAILCISRRDGKDAIDSLRNGKTPVPDLIFMDLNMPRLNGKQCLYEMKKMKKLSSTPVIIYTTARNEQDEEEVRHLGAALFLTKPTRFDEICKAVSWCLKRYERHIDA